MENISGLNLNEKEAEQRINDLFGKRKSLTLKQSIYSDFNKIIFILLFSLIGFFIPYILNKGFGITSTASTVPYYTLLFIPISLILILTLQLTFKDVIPILIAGFYVILWETFIETIGWYYGLWDFFVDGESVNQVLNRGFWVGVFFYFASFPVGILYSYLYLKSNGKYFIYLILCFRITFGYFFDIYINEFTSYGITLIVWIGLEVGYLITLFLCLKLVKN